MSGRLKSLCSALIGLAVLWVPSSAIAAQNVIVRAGAHDGFSRLVFQFDRQTLWSLKKREHGYSIFFASQDLDFDFSRVFRFIGKNRITSVASRVEFNKSVVSIDVACECHVVFFAIGTGRLVVDIVDGQADETALLEKSETPAVKPESDVVVAETETPQTADAGLIRKANDEDSRANSIAGSTEAIRPTQLPALTMPLTVPDLRIELAQNELIEQLGRAMSQGVVQSAILDGDPFTAIRQQTEPTTLPADDPKRPAQMPETPNKDEYQPIDHLNFRTESALDRDKTTNTLAAVAARAARECLDAGFFELASWNTGDDFPTEVGRLRQGLVGELDHVDVAILEKLVRLYIVNGFGSEALGLIRDFKGLVKHGEMLAELAELLESGRVLNGSKLAGQAKCTGPAILWGTSALKTIPVGETPDFDEINRLFTELPKEVRRRIGPVMGQKFLEAGHPERAAEIADLVTRAPGDHGPDFTMFTARLDFAFGRIPAGRAKLLGLINANHKNAAEAVILLLRDYLTRAEAVPQFLIVDAAARALEMRHSTEGEKLRMLELEARAQAQDQAVAFDILVHETKLGLIQNSDRDKIVGILFQSFDALKQPPERLLETFFKYSYFLTTSPEMDSSRRQLAKAFLKIGLPQTALEIFSVIGPTVSI